MTTDRVLMHASCVAVSGRGVLITGPSGSGKSTLALQLMAWGADLVADDQTEITAKPGLTARCPAPLRGLIEARGVGLLTAGHIPQAEVALVVDLAQPEPHRLPPRRDVTILGIPGPLVLGAGNDHLAAAVLCYLKGARQA